MVGSERWIVDSITGVGCPEYGAGPGRVMPPTTPTTNPSIQSFLHKLPRPITDADKPADQSELE